MELSMNYKALAFILGFLVMAGCGDSGNPIRPSSGDFAPSLSVNEIPYNLQKFEVESKFKFADGTEQVLKMNLQSSSRVADENILRRVNERGDFVVEVNGALTNILVDASAQILGGRKPLDEPQGGCMQKGYRQIEGEADFDRLSLNYELRLKISGECSERSFGNFANLQIDELQSLNLNRIARLQESGLWNHAEAREVEIKIHIVGFSEI